MPTDEIVAQAPETFEEQLSRVQQMAHDANGETWDLSANDRAALGAMLDSIHKLAKLGTDWLDGAAAKEMNRLVAINADLLAALHAIADMSAKRARVNMPDGCSLHSFARSAIAKAEVRS